MIESEKTRNLFSELRKRYEFIIMDTPPIGIVGDAFLLNRFVDVTLFVTRYNYSTKKQFSKSLTEAVDNKMKRLFIVFTDIRQKIKIHEINFNNEEKPKQFIILRWFVAARKTIIELIRKF